ncbi:MAG: class I SAM-dependent methyltransferase [Candidatus Helarchaeota archaeon]
MSYSMEEIKAKAFPYFKRLNFAITYAKGKVLEIGCGIGNLTRWFSQSDKVESIIAIDAFSEAIKRLEQYKLMKVTPFRMNLQDLTFSKMQKFDTIVICEVLEHIYLDEELEMLRRLKKYINSNTVFIISTPIGWMVDPFHVRGFSKKKFRVHLKKYYGPILKIDYSSGYSQIAYGIFDLKN